MTPRPYTLIAELTYRCPLRCPYCSNPIDYAKHTGELSADEWRRVFEEAEALGVVQIHLTGGEPLVRRDLEELVRRARSLDLYTNLITSGVPLTQSRLKGLRDAGLDHVQLSFQDVDSSAADRIAGIPAHARKLEVAAWVKSEGLPLTVNIVIHRANIDKIEEIIAMAERLGADKLELASAQYLGWALKNRGALLPAPADLARAREIARAAKDRLRGRMEIVYVTADYVAGRPRACMDGWARRFVHITPTGLVLPCHAAHTIAGLQFETVRARPLAAIWTDSPALVQFRGESWMQEPCRSCPERSRDFGGCRCQAFHLTGDAAAVDPACSLSPAHSLIEAARLAGARPSAPPLVHRSAAP